MDITVSFRHMDASEAVRTYTKEKSARLKKYFDGRISVTWNFSVEKQTHIAHCHLRGNHINYFGEGTGETMYAAIDETIDKIDTQLRRKKEIVKDKLHKTARTG